MNVVQNTNIFLKKAPWRGVLATNSITIQVLDYNTSIRYTWTSRLIENFEGFFAEITSPIWKESYFQSLMNLLCNLALLAVRNWVQVNIPSLFFLRCWKHLHRCNEYLDVKLSIPIRQLSNKLKLWQAEIISNKTEEFRDFFKFSWPVRRTLFFPFFFFWQNRPVTLLDPNTDSN